MNARLRLIEQHEDVDCAVHRNQFAPRQSHLPTGYFNETLGARIERVGERAMWPVMVLIFVFIGLGLALNWFA